MAIASKLEMYRGITLSPILSRLFVSVLVTLYEDFLTNDSLQFGFKNRVAALMLCLPLESQ